jgi:hypothetical protein
MNDNKIITNRFSNPEAEKLYMSAFENDPELYKQYAIDTLQCGGCAFFAPFNSDWGLCCHDESPHHLETVFEHFTCRKQVNEGWESHSFMDFNKNPQLMELYNRRVNLSDQVYDLAKQRADSLQVSVTDIMNALYMKLLFADEYVKKLLSDNALNDDNTE